MKFLLTNDDGIDAAGIAALEQAVAGLGSTIVIAPSEEHSGCGHRLTVGRPLRLDQKSVNRYTLDGTPADCVRVGLGHVDADFDWVLAGINHGGNLGADVHYSGTVAAVREASLLGCKAIAFSQYHKASGRIDWQLAAQWTRKVLIQLLNNSHVSGQFWNVNLPHPIQLPQQTAGQASGPGPVVGSADTAQRDTASQETNRSPDDNARSHLGPEPSHNTVHRSPETALHPRIVYCALDTNPLLVEVLHDQGSISYRGRYADRQRTVGCDVDHCFQGSITVSRIVTDSSATDSSAAQP